jgi:fructoselysine 6-kinase
MKQILTTARFCVDVFPQQNRVLAGGNALNVGANCAKAGARVFLMGNIGTDEYGDKIAESANRHGLNCERLRRVIGETASNKIVLENGERVFVSDAWNDGVLRDYDISPSDEAFLRGMDAVATTVKDYFLEKLLAIRSSSGSSSTFLLAVDFMDDTQCAFREEWREYLSSLDLFFISGKPQYLPILRQWSRDFPKAVLIATLGENGSVAFRGGAQYDCPAAKVAQVIDTTGCGDSYQGAFLVDYLEHGDISRAMAAGAASAAVTLGFVGAVL